MVSSSTTKTLEDLFSLKEGQTFDRKSAKIDVKEIGNAVIGFANADGGKLAIGLEDNGILSGFKDLSDRENKIREFLPRWVSPSPKYSFNSIKFSHPNGVEDNILIIDVEQGTNLYKNVKDEVYLRRGRETKLLDFEERLQLMHDKGLQNFEVNILDVASLEDLDLELLRKHGELIDVSEPERILLARNLAEVKDGQLKLNYAGILLFGKNPQRWISRARIRFLKYEGLGEETGERLNLIKDEIINGPIIRQIETTILLIKSTLRDFTRLDSKSGKFITVPEYPLFAWSEAVVNAVTHRDYNIKGTDIQIKLFENRMEILSPGNFPSTVREDNIRHTHFSRNPNIARVLADTGYVRELGEGVNRMYQEMERAGLPEPTFRGLNGTVSVKLYNDIQNRRLRKEVDLLKKIKHDKFATLSEDEKKAFLYAMENDRISTRECVKLIGKSDATALRVLKNLTAHIPPFLIDRRRFPQDPKAYYEPNKDIFIGQSQIMRGQTSRPSDESMPGTQKLL